MTKFQKVMTRDASLIAVEVWSRCHSALLPVLFSLRWPSPVFIFQVRAVESWRSENFLSTLPRKVESWLRKKQNQLKLLDKGREYFAVAEKLKSIKRSNKRAIVFEDVEEVCDLLLRGLVGLIALYWVYEWNQKPGIKMPSAILKIGKYTRGSDTLFDDGNELIFSYLKTLAKKYSWPAGSETFLSIAELKSTLANPGGFPRQKTKARGKGYFYYRSKLFPISHLALFLRRRRFELIREKAETNMISGMSAYKGLASGRARIVYNHSEINKVKKGDILIAPMTTPWYLPAMRKANAIVTDEGGVVCHAAIIARELKIPCIVGTKIATKVLNDGDLVEVDAERGIVRIIKKAK